MEQNAIEVYLTAVDKHLAELHERLEMSDVYMHIDLPRLKNYK